MTKKYVNCPTCGGLASYLSANWAQANVLITDEKLNYADDVKRLAEDLVRLELIVQDKISVDTLSSDHLLELYMMAVRRETIEQHERKEEEYRKMEEDLREAPYKYRFGFYD